MSLSPPPPQLLQQVMSLSPPPPQLPLPLPPPSTGFHFPVIAIALIGITLTAILLLSYYIFVIKCCLNFSNRRRSHTTADITSTTTPSPKPGLEESIIRSIPIINFRKSSTRKNTNNDEDTEVDDLECAVCLCAFEEGDKLRVIPNCCHAFHIDCLDIWLQNTANCPLCRCGVSAATMLYNPDMNWLKNFHNAGISISNSSSRSNSNSTTRSIGDNFSGDEDDYLVIEIQGSNLEEPREAELSKMKLGRVSSMGDELIECTRKKDIEFEIRTTRRSISMDYSSKKDFCIEIQEYCTTSSSSNNMEVNNDQGNTPTASSNSNSNNSNKARRSIFSFGYSRSSKSSVQPLQLEP